VVIAMLYTSIDRYWWWWWWWTNYYRVMKSKELQGHITVRCVTQ